MAGLLNWNAYGSPLMGQGVGEMPAYGKLNAPSISQGEELLPYLLMGGVYRSPLRFIAKKKAATAKRTKKNSAKRRRRQAERSKDIRSMLTEEENPERVLPSQEKQDPTITPKEYMKKLAGVGEVGM